MGDGLPVRGLLSGGPVRGRHASRARGARRVESLEEALSYFRPTSEITDSTGWRPNAASRSDARPVRSALAGDEGLRRAGRRYDVLRRRFGRRGDLHAGRAGFRRRPSWPRRSRGLAASWSSSTRAANGALSSIRASQINLGSIGKGRAADVCMERLRELRSGRRAGSRRSEQRAGKRLARRRRMVDRHRRRPPNRPTRGGGPTAQPRPGHLVVTISVVSPRRTTIWAHSRSAVGLAGRRRAAATVLAPTAALADALSTAFFVMGPELSRAYCRPIRKSA